ncbi:hypothetical protein BD413DRAFT_617756 [Trametes elegans]|nr:hypothetical protein BD413DRAFT_617756 [Trametes elegans]
MTFSHGPWTGWPLSLLQKYERPLWTPTHPAKAPKGKARADVTPLAEEDEGESEVGSGADEYQPSGFDMNSSESEVEEEVDHNDVAEAMLLGAASPKIARMAGKKKRGPKKHDLQHALERPTWKAPQATAGGAGTTPTAAVMPVAAPPALIAHPPTFVPPVPLAPFVPPPTVPTAAPATGLPLALPLQQALQVPGAVPALLPNIAHAVDVANEYQLVPPVNAGAVLPLNSQDPRIRAVMRNTFPRLEAAVVFDNAFPDALGRTKSVVKSLINAAEHLNLPGLVTRLRMDAVFTRALTAIPNQRISTFRGSIKKATDAHVIAFYQLNATTCSDKVNWLFNHLTYIYPHDYEKRTVPWSKPYQHPAVAAVLHACFWTGTQPFANRYPNEFTSSMLSRPLEREVPAPMLALIGAALHASLLEWKSGTHRAAAFSGDAFVDVYNEHCLLLAGIRNQNPHAYHTMMHWMYNHASGIWTPTASNAAEGAGGPTDNALAHVDINAMDVD